MKRLQKKLFEPEEWDKLEEKAMEEQKSVFLDIQDLMNKKYGPDWYKGEI